MTDKTLQFSGFSISVPESWAEITDTLEARDAPLTIADPESGVGAMQFSVALYRGGELPAITRERLGEMLDEFARCQGLEQPFDKSSSSSEVDTVGEGYRWGDDFVRAWYVSDGKNILFVTYVCDWSQRGEESPTTERAVQSIRFDSGPAPTK